ncbi:DUF397 domain-containing protein [Streptomyces sp. NPDC058284]|uniref:DUF397 domain-containing protein n=1 Tax=unclassified Streptomyces TaxID=2593676 RepID=UPI00366512A5
MTTSLHWQKSTFSGGGDGNACVELASTGNHIRLRESDEPGVELATAPASLARLLRAIKQGER